MSQAAFERIAGKYPAYRQQVGLLQRYLSKQSVGAPIRPENAADFVRLTPDMVEALLGDLVGEKITKEEACLICPSCDGVVEAEPDEEKNIQCDACTISFREGQLTREKCHVLVRPVTHTLKETAAHYSSVSENPLKVVTSRRQTRIEPWETLSEEQYTISMPMLSAGTRDRALESLTRYGIVRLRWEADVPTPEKLQSLEEWIGPARSEQNDFQGKVKSLHPKYDTAPITGDSAKELPPHVDGTQDEVTPAVLAFQYDRGATWGGESTFIDMAAMLSSLDGKDLEGMLTILARRDASYVEKKKGKWTGQYKGPVIRAELGGHSISIRLRGDDLLKAIPDCEEEFNRLKGLLSEWSKKHVLRYTPNEGDLVIFDNWRLLHGRKPIGGRHQRIHDRIWIDHLHPGYDGKYFLGIRPLAPGLMHAIQKANEG